MKKKKNKPKPTKPKSIFASINVSLRIHKRDNLSRHRAGIYFPSHSTPSGISNHTYRGWQARVKLRTQKLAQMLHTSFILFSWLWFFPLIFLSESYSIISFQMLIYLVWREKIIPNLAVLQLKELPALNSSRCAVYKVCSDQPERYQHIRRTERTLIDWKGLQFNVIMSKIFF